MNLNSKSLLNVSQDLKLFSIGTATKLPTGKFKMQASIGGIFNSEIINIGVFDQIDDANNKDDLYFNMILFYIH